MNQPNLCQFSFPLKVLPFTLVTDKNCVAKAVSSFEIINLFFFRQLSCAFLFYFRLIMLIKY